MDLQHPKVEFISDYTVIGIKRMAELGIKKSLIEVSKFKLK